MITKTCLFKYNKIKAIILLYINDLLIAGKSFKIVKLIKNMLASKFTLKKMGEVSKFIGF